MLSSSRSTKAAMNDRGLLRVLGALILVALMGGLLSGMLGPGLVWGMGPGVMWGYGRSDAAPGVVGWAWGLGMALGMLAGWAALVVGVVVLVRWALVQTPGDPRHTTPTEPWRFCSGGTLPARSTRRRSRD